MGSLAIFFLSWVVSGEIRFLFFMICARYLSWLNRGSRKTPEESEFSFNIFLWPLKASEGCFRLCWCSGLPPLRWSIPYPPSPSQAGRKLQGRERRSVSNTWNRTWRAKKSIESAPALLNDFFFWLLMNYWRSVKGNKYWNLVKLKRFDKIDNKNWQYG